MDSLSEVIQTCPIIDHHAHNLLLPSELGTQNLLSATTEASGGALRHATSTLAHYRAVKQLARVLDCEASWPVVQRRIEEERAAPDDAWARRCFEGIATALIDDGLDRNTVHPYDWHDRLTASKCKRIVRIECVAQDILVALRQEGHEHPGELATARFIKAIEAAVADPEVVGFKSVICYRTGLIFPAYSNDVNVIWEELDHFITSSDIAALQRLEDERFNPVFVHLAAQAIAKSGKPFQFHTGLGDNDLMLYKASAAHLQPFIAAYPDVIVMILHASYPFTKEAGYLASVYANCYLDIGEVFPFVSHEGQEKVIREALEMCPTEKLCWSTDGHWFPETYLLAVMQVREGLEKVMTEYVNAGVISTQEAIRSVQDILYETSRRLYKLDLPALGESTALDKGLTGSQAAGKNPLATFEAFLKNNPSIRYLQLQFIDYTASRRGRMIPVKRARDILRTKKYIGVQRGVLRTLQPDIMPPNTHHQGQLYIFPQTESLYATAREGLATVTCELGNEDGTELAYDPRTILRKTLEAAGSKGVEVTVGFEIEVVFMEWSKDEGRFNPARLGYGHAWSMSRVQESKKATDLMKEVLDALAGIGAEVEQWHAETSPSQYEIILSPLPALAAVDKLLAARSTIEAVADAHGLKATLVPRPLEGAATTGAHVHLSLSPPTGYESFYAGILAHLQGIMALTESLEESYRRVGAGNWSGGRWLCWGTQNRETPLRKIQDSHWECKIVDGFANMYLVVAALVGCGMQGMADKAELRIKDCTCDPETLDEEGRAELGIKDLLPISLHEALGHLEEDETLARVLGKEAVDCFLAVKRAEDELVQGMGEFERRNWLIERY